MTHLLMTANKISEDLKTVLLTISDNHGNYFIIINITNFIFR